MKKYNLVLAIIAIAVLFSCGKKEKVALQNKVDSLSAQLTTFKEVETKMNEVGVLIDSIDASRKSLQLSMVEGNNYADYVNRLQKINLYVKQTEAKLLALEKSNKTSSKASASTIRRLKADLEKRSEEILELQLQIASLTSSNTMLWKKISEKDSTLTIKDQIIKLKESDIALLEKKDIETRESNQKIVANLYFDQAKALEMAANRTQFAPNKKKVTRQEALELYRLSSSSGNINAQARIDELEKKLN